MKEILEVIVDVLDSQAYLLAQTLKKSDSDVYAEMEKNIELLKGMVNNLE